jgi:hypothetical protein
LEGVPFHVYSSQQPNSVPFYRFYDATSFDHLYKTSSTTPAGYVFEGIQCYVFTTQQSGTIPLYRYFNTVTGEHFYVTSLNNGVAGQPNWNFEGVAAYVFP